MYILAVNKRVWNRTLGKDMCSNVTRENIEKKNNQLVMFAHQNGNENVDKLLKFFTYILAKKFTVFHECNIKVCPK